MITDFNLCLMDLVHIVQIIMGDMIIILNQMDLYPVNGLNYRNPLYIDYNQTETSKITSNYQR